MQPDGQAPHILVTNHDPEILRLMADLLREAGYRVSIHPRSGEDLAAVAALAPDLIIIDYMWPSPDSEWTLLNLLRIDPRSRAIPVILCTGAVAQVRPMQDHLRSLGIRVVYKPFDIDHLLSEIQHALTHPAASAGQATVPGE